MARMACSVQARRRIGSVRAHARRAEAAYRHRLLEPDEKVVARAVRVIAKSWSRLRS